jgi:alginate O-acetyltransferase complex protein AlgJ
METTRQKPSAQRTERGTNRSRDLAVTVIFATFLALPAIAALTGLGQDTDLVEQRILADEPEWPSTLEDWTTYPDRFQLFFEDHFGLRRWLIYSHKRFLRKVWKKGRNDVLYGEDDWLYYSGFGIVGDYRRTDPFRARDLEEWNVLAEASCQQSKELEYYVLWAVAPNKFSIYPEFAPAGLKPEGAKARLDQFVDYFANHPCFDLLDLRPKLREAKKSQLVYWKTDTHWTDVGAIVGMEAILGRVKTRVPHVRVHSLDDFDIENIEQPGGDLAKMLGLQEDYRELVPSVKPKYTPLARRVDHPPWCADLKDQDLDQILVFETGQTDLPRAVIFHDSFGLALRMFIAESFERVVFVTTKEYRLDWVAQERPDVVIRLFVERRLSERRANGKRRGN